MSFLYIKRSFEIRELIGYTIGDIKTGGKGMDNLKKLTLFGATSLLLMACGEIEPRADEGEVGTEEDIEVVETQEGVEHTREDEGEYAEDARQVFGENFEKILLVGIDNPSGEIYVVYEEELKSEDVENIVNNQVKEYLYKMKENDLSDVSIYIYSPLETKYEYLDKEIIAEVIVDRSDLDNLDIDSIRYENIGEELHYWWENPYIKGGLNG